MPEALTSPRDILGQTMAQGRKSVVPYLAEMLKTNRIAEVEAPEERKRFWQAAMTDEQEQQRWQEEMAARGIVELTPELAVDIGLKISQEKFPDRWDMLGQEGRNTQADQARWAWKHMKAGPPKAMQEGEQDVSQASDLSAVGAAQGAPEQNGQPVVQKVVRQPAGAQAPAAG